jgi:hypothetical protein
MQAGNGSQPYVFQLVRKCEPVTIVVFGIIFGSFQRMLVRIQLQNEVADFDLVIAYRQRRDQQQHQNQACAKLLHTTRKEYHLNDDNALTIHDFIGAKRIARLKLVKSG